MLPGPTTELMLIAATVKTYGGAGTRKCSRFMHGMLDNLNVTGKGPIVTLRQTMPSLELAAGGAVATLNALCAICEKRGRCKRPLV